LYSGYEKIGLSSYIVVMKREGPKIMETLPTLKGRDKKRGPKDHGCFAYIKRKGSTGNLRFIPCMVLLTILGEKRLLPSRLNLYLERIQCGQEL
jgi:hypothetical protein